MSLNSWYDVNEPGDVIICRNSAGDIFAWRLDEAGVLNPVALDEVMKLQVAKRIEERKSGRNATSRLAELIDDDGV